MKSKLLLLFSLLISAGIQTFSQSNLYVGYRGNGTLNETQLARLDTTGGVITFIGNTTISSDYDPIVHGLYGMALHPFTGKVYVVYGVSGDNANDRRLGTINLTSAAITDIAQVGAIIDITFVDTTLYGSYGNEADNEFVTINTVNGDTSTIFIHGTSDDGSSGINFDYYKSRILRSIQGSPTYTVIDVNTMTESSLPHPGHPGWTNNLLTLNNGNAYSIGSNSIQLLNTNTFEYELIHSFPASNWIHSGVFGNYPLSVWVNGNRNMCPGESSILTVVGSGVDFEWYKDGVLIADATSSTYTVTEAGEYLAIVDGKTLNTVKITVSPVIASGFTISENPAYLEGAADVTVDFSANATGIRYTYDWDSGAGESATTVSPSFTYDALGDYVITLIVTDTVSIQNCTRESPAILTVAGGVSIEEVENKLMIYPVPADNELYIDFDHTAPYTVQIIDLSGAVVLEHQTNLKGQSIIDLSDLSSGTYICRINGENYKIDRLFVKK